MRLGVEWSHRLLFGIILAVCPAELYSHRTVLCRIAELEKEEAILTLGNLAHNNDANKVFIAKSRAIFPLVSLLLKGTPRAKEEAARTIGEWGALLESALL